MIIHYDTFSLFLFPSSSLPFYDVLFCSFPPPSFPVSFPVKVIDIFFFFFLLFYSMIFYFTLIYPLLI